MVTSSCSFGAGVFVGFGVFVGLGVFVGFGIFVASGVRVGSAAWTTCVAGVATQTPLFGLTAGRTQVRPAQQPLMMVQGSPSVAQVG